MANYTPNYGLLYPPTAQDFVDVESQLNNNLLVLDNLINKLTNYKFYDNVIQSSLPVAGNNRGDKIYSNYDHSVNVWNGSRWVQASATPVWTDLAYASGIIASGKAEDVILPGFYLKDNTVYMRGIFYRASNAAWAQGQAVNVFPPGSIPAPSATRSKTVVGGLSTSSTAQWYQADARTDGSFYITKYGATAQTAGNNENYVSIMGLWYEIG